MLSLTIEEIIKFHIDGVDDSDDEIKILSMQMVRTLAQDHPLEFLDVVDSTGLKNRYIARIYRETRKKVRKVPVEILD